MPFPSRLLNEGEEVVVDLRPHALVLAGPVLLAVLLIAVAAVGAALQVPSAVGWVLVVLLALALVRLVVRYLRWRSTNLIVTTDRLVRRSGVLARRGREIPLDHLSDISYRQSLLERVIGAGDLILESAGRDSQEVFPALPRPAEVQNEIYRLMSQRQGSARVGWQPRPLSLPEQLEKLADLHRRGVLSDAELRAGKDRLLGQGS
jgi:membrane protein YdbS with pleckstrin-like domain